MIMSTMELLINIKITFIKVGVEFLVIGRYLTIEGWGHCRRVGIL